ncbi:MAG: hypothetical protein CMQ40_00590 [Gammaproteobacteria bacterium]|nr:hypothetical protein [Gammaproteobacteria bacterium]|tara:strand:- start:511 stop:714 length:204 start_codon:yes stop_codon:yes gene_type:complete
MKKLVILLFNIMAPSLWAEENLTKGNESEARDRTEKKAEIKEKTPVPDIESSEIIKVDQGKAFPRDI